MPFKFNPFTGNFDQTGSGGGGASYIDGEVQNFSALPQTVGSPAVDSAYLVREAEGTWLLGRKPAGIYIRTANTGTRASDWTYAGEFPDVFNDANLVVYNNTDSTKNVKFDASAIATATTRTISVPNKNIMLDDAGDSRTPSSHAASHASAGSDPLFDQDLNTGSVVSFSEIYGEQIVADGALQVPSTADSVSFTPQGIDFGGSAAATTRTNLGLGDAATADIGTGSTEVAAGDHGHGNLSSDGKLGSTAGLPVVTTTAGAVTTLALGTAGQVLTVNSGANGVEFAAASGGGVTTGSVDNAILRADGTGGSTSQSSDILIDDATTSTQNNVTISNQHSGQTNSALVLTPKGTGAFIVGPKPDGTAVGGNARGDNAIDIQTLRSAATHVASGASSIAIGVGSRASGVRCITIAALNAAATGDDCIAIGRDAAAGAGANAVAIARGASASGTSSIALSNNAFASAVNSTSVGAGSVADLRGMFSTVPFRSVYWSGQTTNNTATILNLDGTATNRFTIAASTALAVDVLLVARRATTQDKWLVARRFLGIRRDGSNNTSLIGTVQTLGTDQSEGSPTWTFALTADDTNEALQLEVTGATGETVEWRATAFYRVA